MDLLPMDRAGWLSWFFDQTSVRLPATAARLDEEQGRIAPDSVAVARRRARAFLADARDGEAAPWCAGSARQGCIDTSLSYAARLQRTEPALCEGYLLDARARVEAGDDVRAVRELAAASEHVGDRTACLMALVDLAAEARNEDAVTEALERLSHAGCASAVECGANLQFVALWEQKRHNYGKALILLQRARDRLPESDTLLSDIAELESRLNMHRDAVAAYEELARRQPRDERWPAATLREQAAIRQAPVRP